MTKSKKVKSSNSKYAAIALIAVAIVAAAMYFGSTGNLIQIFNDSHTSNPFVPSSAVQSGSCQKDTQCFITHCKGYAYSCVNTTELSSYGKKCDNYLDWIIDMQNPSKCGCVQNACTLK